MPRALWAGSLSFGLVNVPVTLASASRDRDIRMREVDTAVGKPVQVRRICTLDGKEVPPEEVAHGLDLDGEVVVLTDDDLSSARPTRTETIEITKFVNLPEIDPVRYDRPYWVTPSGSGQGTLRAYLLLVDALHSTGLAAMGQTVIHNREHPVVIRASERRLLLSTLLFDHEIRNIDDLDIPDAPPDPESVAGAVAVIQELTTDFDPTAYHDRHRRRLQSLIDEKAAGKRTTQPPEPPQPTPTPDLIGALQQSLAEIRASQPSRPKSSRRRSPPARQKSKPTAKTGQSAGKTGPSAGKTGGGGAASEQEPGGKH